MKPLLEYNDRHPVITSIVGSLGSMLGAAGAWYLQYVEQITVWAAHLSAVGGLLIFAGTIALKIWTWSKAIVDRHRRSARRRLKRRVLEIDGPFVPIPMPKLRVEYFDERNWTLLEPVEWIDPDTGYLIRVAKGERTDFASIPRLLWSIIPPTGRHGYAAVIHDHLYSVRGVLPAGQFTRSDCDRIFREIMKASGVRWTRRWVMWLGVRIGGWVPWHFGPRDDDDDDFQTPGIPALA